MESTHTHLNLAEQYIYNYLSNNHEGHVSYNHTQGRNPISYIPTDNNIIRLILLP